MNKLGKTDPTPAQLIGGIIIFILFCFLAIAIFSQDSGNEVNKQVVSITWAFVGYAFLILAFIGAIFLLVYLAKKNR